MSSEMAVKHVVSDALVGIIAYSSPSFRHGGTTFAPGAKLSCLFFYVRFASFSRTKDTYRAMEKARARREGERHSKVEKKPVCYCPSRSRRMYRSIHDHLLSCRYIEWNYHYVDVNCCFTDFSFFS